MKVQEVNQSIIGRKVKGIFTAMAVTGTITEINEDEYTVSVKIALDKPVQWGDDEYTEYWSSARKSDGWGNLQHTELLGSLDWLKDYQPKDKHFTSEEEIKMIAEKLDLAGLTNEQLKDKRDEIVLFYDKLIEDAIMAGDHEKRWNLSDGLMSVTAVIDHFKYNRGMEV